MKILAAIGIIIAMIAAIGVVFLFWAMAWLTFEETETGRAITQKIIERTNK